MSYAQVGRDQEAQTMVGKVTKGWPDAMKTVQFIMSIWGSKDHQAMKRFAEGYAKAGFLGNPSEFYKKSVENRLTGEEIRKLFFGRKVGGSTMVTGKKWWIERSTDGKSTIRGGDDSDTGKSWIEEDMLCDQWDNSYEGLSDCWAIYRNPEGTPDYNDEFIGAPVAGLYPFSQIE
jgi:hypothetical protein